MSPRDGRFQRAFTQPLSSHKIDMQLRTAALDEWVHHLTGRWPFSGPEITPWGHRWVRLRDPDGLLIAIYEIPDPTSGLAAPA